MMMKSWSAHSVMCIDWPQQWVAAGHPSLHLSAESAPHSRQHTTDTGQNRTQLSKILYPMDSCLQTKLQQIFKTIRDDMGCLNTSLAFFCRSTIWERRCVISSCCLEASSLFLASSSDRDDICRLELPERIHMLWSDVRIGPQKAASLQCESETAVGEYVILNSVPAVSPVLTQFFNAVIDKLLLFFLIGDRFCLQVTGLKETWSNHDQRCQLFIYMMVSLQTQPEVCVHSSCQHTKPYTLFSCVRCR